MSKRKGIFFGCDEAALCCDKSQYKEVSFREKIRLNIHLVLCKACRLYSSRNSRLTWLLKQIEIEELSEEDKRIMKQNIKEQTSN